MATQASIDAIQKLYISFYQRPADVTGLEYWANRADAANGNMSAIVNAFATSAEATANYGSLNTNQLVNTIYTSLFGRAPDAAGLNFYSNAIAAGTMTPGQLALNILDGATGSDATIVANKLTVAKAYTTAMDTTAEILAYSNATAQTNAKNLLGAVNALDSSVTNATNQIPAVMVSNVNNAAATIAAAGTTFTFTSGLDTYAGTTNNDVVSGAIADIQQADNVRGGAGTGDVLNLTTSGIINLTAAAAAAANYNTAGVAGINATNITGFETLNINGTTTGNVVVVGNVAAAPAAAGDFVTVNGSSVNDIIVAATVANTGTITGGTGTDQLTVTGAVAATSLDNVSGFETIVLSNAAASLVTSKDALVATGATLALNFNGSTGVTFNGSAETDGKFAVTATGVTGASSYVFGAGNDTLNITGNAVVDTISIVSSTGIGFDVITGFLGGADVLSVSKTGLPPATGAAAWTTANGAVVAVADFKAVAALGAAGTALDASDDVIVFTNSTFANAAAVNTALAAQNGVTAKSAIVVYTNSTTGFTTVAYDSDIGNATNTVVDLVQLSGTTTASLTNADFLMAV